MKKFLTLTIITLTALAANSQSIVGTPNSMYLVYNNPNSYFYLKIDGKEKSSTEIENMYQVDNKIVQLLTVKKSDFMTIKSTIQKRDDILMQYYRFEKEYLDTIFQKQITFTVEMRKTSKGRDYIFWTYHSLLPQDTIATDSTRTIPIDKQLYVATEVGSTIVGASTAFFKGESNLEELKQFLFNIMESITISPKRIDVYDLNKRVNAL